MRGSVSSAIKTVIFINKTIIFKQSKKYFEVWGAIKTLILNQTIIFKQSKKYFEVWDASHFEWLASQTRLNCLSEGKKDKETDTEN